MAEMVATVDKARKDQQVDKDRLEHLEAKVRLEHLEDKALKDQQVVTHKEETIRDGGYAENAATTTTWL